MSRLRVRSPLLAVALAAVTLSLVALPSAHATTARYVGGGTAANRTNGSTIVDAGGVVCDTGDGVGAGGLCLPFGGGNAVEVVDDVAGDDLAFQVCIDNNGDGVCTFPDPDPTCPDVVVFSHDDSGAFYNPVGPLPTGFTAGCPGGDWDGYVVMLCEGSHVEAQAADAHTHPATSGTGRVRSGGEGLGTFCGNPFVSKPYVVTDPEGNFTCGIRVVSDGTPGSPLGGQSQWFGTAQAGPFRVVGATGVRIECAIVVNGLNAGTFLVGDGPGAASAFGQISLTADPSDVVTVCTEVYANGGLYYEHDADPATDGVQCSPASIRSVGSFHVMTVEQANV